MNTSCDYTMDLRNSSFLFNYILYHPHELILNTFVTPCIILMGFLGNVSFIWTVVRVSSLHTSTFIGLCMLALTDLFTLTGAGINQYNILTSPIRSVDLPIVFNIGTAITWFGFFASVGLVTLVSLERYLAICHPIKHHLIKGTKRTIRLSLIIMPTGLVMTGLIMIQTLLTRLVLCVMWPSDEQFTDYPRQISTAVQMFILPRMLSIFTNFIFLIIYLVILLFNCYMYWTILTTLQRRKDNRKLNISVNFERNIQQITRMVIINGTVYFLYSTIFQVNMILGIMTRFDPVHFDKWVRFLFIHDIAMVLNASSNPVIYFMTNPRYRRAFSAPIIKCFGVIFWKSGKDATTFRR